jgi:segregation and condensation protein B
MDENKQLSTLEAILFACGEPVKIDRIAQVMDLTGEQVQALSGKLQEHYDKRNSALRILKLADQLQLSTRSEYFGIIREILDLKRNVPLSQAAFEVLAVIAYNQPITKSFIEQVRGVDCSGVVASLCEKGLIEEKGRLELPGRPLIYGTTPAFLRCFSLSSLEDLPPIPELKNPDSKKESEAKAENSDAE